VAFYSALICSNSLGPAGIELVAASYGTNPTVLLGNTQLQYTRVSPITHPHYIIEEPGGFISGDFVVPPEVAARSITQLRLDSFVWIFDGATPIFFGKLTDQPTPSESGEVLVSCYGFWLALQQTRMREVWDDQDMGKWLPSAVNDHNPQVDLLSNGNIKIAWPNGTVVTSANRAQLDYFLFNEPVGVRDTKRITAFDISCSNDDGNASTAIDYVVEGYPTTISGTTDQLVIRGTAVGSFADKEGAIADSWPESTGYRALRFGMKANATQTLGQDRSFTFDRVRVATRETLFTTFGSPPQTSDLAADVFRVHTNSVNWLDTPPDFWRQTSGGTAAYGTDPVTRSIVASGIGCDSMVFTDWTTPAEVLSAFQTIDGFRCGFYFPTAPGTGWWAAGQVPWPFMMPELFYQPWAALDSPDYRISIRRGAQPEMDDSPQPLVQALYVTYEHANGRAASAYFEDNDTVNYLYAQGIRRAEDYNIEVPVSDLVASNLADQVFTLRRQPLAVGKVKIWANRPGSIVDGNGGGVTRLSDIRPGVAEIVDLPRTKFKTGRVTRVEWWGQTLDEEEHVELTLEHPGKVNLPRRLGSIGVLAQRTLRVRKGGARR